MSQPINDGGQAFPRAVQFDDAFINGHGMTLRDYFAGQALAGSLASQTPESHWSFAALPEETTNDKAKNGIARLCYEIADAMLKAREAK